MNEIVLGEVILIGRFTQKQVCMDFFDNGTAKQKLNIYSFLAFLLTQEYIYCRLQRLTKIQSITIPFAICQAKENSCRVVKSSASSSSSCIFCADSEIPTLVLSLCEVDGTGNNSMFSYM